VSSPNPSRALSIRGLFADAIYQVLDNKVFRVLIAVTLIPILLTFFVGLKEDSISVLFGKWEFDYPAMMAMLGEDPRPVAIEWLLDVVIDQFAGGIGMTLAIAATAFFVPRMLEKGAADLVFAKPLPRWALYLSRYITGLLFVGLLGLFLTVGMYLGVLIVSGYSAPAILWSSLTLIYLFSMVHCVTMLIGVYTRSTSAAMIMGIVFFFGNGCVHSGWQLKEQFGDMLMIEEQAAKNDPKADEIKEEEKDNWRLVRDSAFFALDALHYPLPKTSDASLVSLHVQDALLGSGRMASREQMLDTGDELHAERQKEWGDSDSPMGDQDPDTWFERRFAWDSEELRFNVWFSILSSMAFTTVLLLLGMWKLRRSDF
jgi:ABC-type transport system involved in multi-copper enzyme maturation permease subunit